MANSSKDAQSKLLIADLSVQLAEVKVRLAELIEENSHLKAELEKANKADADVILKDGLYYTPQNDGPFCTACFDKDRKLIRVTELGSVFRDIAKYQCPVCKSSYGGRIRPR